MLVEKVLFTRLDALDYSPLRYAPVSFLLWPKISSYTGPISNRRSAEMITVLISIMASPSPIQYLGPCSKGRYAPLHKMQNHGLGVSISEREEYRQVEASM